MRDFLLTRPRAMLMCGMGISKTAAVFWAACDLLEDAAIRGVLVIAPVRVCNLTWPMEGRLWDQFRWLRVANLREPEGIEQLLAGTADVYVINYEALASRDVTRQIPREPTQQECDEMLDGVVPVTATLKGQVSDDDLASMALGEIPKSIRFTRSETTHYKGFVEKHLTGKRWPFNMVVFDEITKAKNHDVKGIKALYKELKQRPSTRRAGLTGTPAPNSLMDLFAQYRLLDDGARLGHSITHFKETYFTKDYNGHTWSIKEGAEKEIYDKIADITLSLRTRDWIDLPEPIIEDVEVTLPDEVLKQYKQFEKDLIIELAEGEITAANSAVLVTKLQQFTAGQTYDGERLVHELHNEKIEALRALAAKHKEPLLVACIFQHEQAMVRKCFPLAVFFADAKTAKTQENLLEAWNRGDIPMLVAHPASVGHGLNLQRGGCKLIYMSLTFNREWYEQMICRLSRRGQTKPVTVYRLMCPGTVDEAVAEALADKANTERRLMGWLTNKQNERKAA